MISAKSENSKLQPWTVLSRVLAVGLGIITLSTSFWAQSFNSGSDGSDGALTVAANQGTIVFDPKDSPRWGRVLDLDGDGVYNFTTITIGAGSTLRLSGERVNRPLYWLASGDVVISGALDLSGGAGSRTSDLSLRRELAIPGSGGYAGGVAGQSNTSVLATSGEGPGGGSGAVDCAQSATRLCGKGGTFTGNRFLIPLIGGSGGGGASYNDGYYYGGGAGGGALLVASSTAITLTGSISADGGLGGASIGGGGSGGAIRLVGPNLSGSGHLSVGGTTGWSHQYADVNGGGPGWVRLESFTGGTSFTLDTGGTFVTRGSPVDSSTLRPASSIRVTAIDGIPVPQDPSGSFVVPDVTINKNGPVNVGIAAAGIPPGTVVTLQIYPQSPTDQTTVNLPTAQATLAGTLELSMATVTFTFPYGFSRGYVRASWTQ
jgi:hypothetical protein